MVPLPPDWEFLQPSHPKYDHIISTSPHFVIELYDGPVKDQDLKDWKNEGRIGNIRKLYILDPSHGQHYDCGKFGFRGHYQLAGEDVTTLLRLVEGKRNERRKAGKETSEVVRIAASSSYEDRNIKVANGIDPHAALHGYNDLPDLVPRLLNQK